MSNAYYDSTDLKRFSEVSKHQPELGAKFFEYYERVFAPGALSSRDKSLIALAVAHAVQCPYCIDAYTTGCLSNGVNEQQMMEAVHVAAAIRAGASLVHAVQMMRRAEQVAM